MALSVGVHSKDGDKRIRHELGEGKHLFGFERCRYTLWGHDSVIALGLELIPFLREGGVIWIEGKMLDDLEQEAHKIIEYAETISQETGYQADFIRNRTENVLNAIAKAREVDGVVLIS